MHAEAVSVSHIQMPPVLHNIKLTNALTRIWSKCGQVLKSEKVKGDICLGFFNAFLDSVALEASDQRKAET